MTTNFHGSRLLLTFLLLACSSKAPIQAGSANPPKSATRTSAPTVLPVATPVPTSSISTAASERPNFENSPGEACGALNCLAFDSAESAINHLLKKAPALVLAVGEIHAQKGNSLKATPTQRFARLLPLFQKQARHLVLELWTGRNDCGDNRVATVKEAQKPVVQAQSATNQNDYFELGKQAKAHGIFPRALVPSCEDYARILAAKSGDIALMLELTAVKTQELVESLLQLAGSATQSPFIITYGGALHNDVTPKPGRETWSFGPNLQRSTHGRFVELDLVLREQVRDTESFSTLPWYPHFRQESLEKHYVLYQTGDTAFALIFPAERYLP